jgi:hypothetical protein
MVGVGNSSNRTELRRKPRRLFHYNAAILTDGKSPPRTCAIADISESGARILLESDSELPDRFLLLLSRNGQARRKCRVVWRNGLVVGVEFPNHS